MVTSKNGACLWRGLIPVLAGVCALMAGATTAGARDQPGVPPGAPAPWIFPTYPVEGPYGPYSDLVPNSGQVSTADTSYAQLPRSPYRFAPPPVYPANPTVPSYSPAYALPPPAPANTQHPVTPPLPPEQYAESATPAPVTTAPVRTTPVRQTAAVESTDAGNGAASESENRYPNPLLGVITQAEIGFAYHDAGVFGRHKEPGGDVDGEIRFLPIEWLDFMASPRPHIGFHANTSGGTNQIFTGITWEFWFWDNFSIDPSFGLSFNDACCLDHGPPVDSKQLGSHVLFREAVDLGWNFSGPHSVSILLDHVSHGHILAHENEGMDTLGLRYGYRF